MASRIASEITLQSENEPRSPPADLGLLGWACYNQQKIYGVLMAKILHARVDKQTEQQLEELKQRFGWSDSQVVRRGIRSLASLLGSQDRREIVGVGRFESGLPDLGSDKSRLQGFGR